MLKALSCTSNRLAPELLLTRLSLLRPQVSSRFKSTNTAINSSLRRSLREGEEIERRTPRFRERDDSDAVHLKHWTEGLRRPDHQSGQDAEDMDASARTKISKKMLMEKRRTVRRAKNDAAFGFSPEKKYNYSIVPGGNRTVRRAAKFGHNLESPGSDTSQLVARRAAHRLALTDRQDRSPRWTAKVDRGDEHSDRFSMPRDFADHREASSQAPRPSFKTDRQGYTSAAEHRENFQGYRRDLHGDNDQPPFQRESNVPFSMPYTTPASEFLYGTSVVVSTLRSSRRKLYKLYIYDGDNREARHQDDMVRRLALKSGVIVEKVKGEWIKLMDKMSTGRPHNGYILEASPLPKLPVTGILPVEKRDGSFNFILDHQTLEDAAINGTDTNIKYEVSFQRYPFVLLLVGILDPGNLGAIMRTAFFLGVDAVAISTRSSAPISPVALKASSGASEDLPLVSVNQPERFIDSCKSNGWKTYAAVAPSPGKRSGVGNYLTASSLGSPVRNHPCILILGAEGEGLHWNIQRKADFDVGIHSQRRSQSRVDSLNVSVAAGLLCEAFLRKPARLNNANARTSDTNSAGATQSADENRVF